MQKWGSAGRRTIDDCPAQPDKPFYQNPCHALRKTKSKQLEIIKRQFQDNHSSVFGNLILAYEWQFISFVVKFFAKSPAFDCQICLA